MAESITDRIFASLQSVDADELFVEELSMPDYPYVEDDVSEKSFRDFMDRPSMKKLSGQQKNQIRNLWIEGGQPMINILPKGAKGGSGDVNRAFFTSMYNIEDKDRMNIFEHQLLDDFMAEISHGRKYARKSGETIDHWQKRRQKMWNLSAADEEKFGEDRYGQITSADGKRIKTFPFEDKGPMYSIGYHSSDDPLEEWKTGDPVAVDEEGNIYPDVRIPEYAGKKEWRPDSTGYSIFDKWQYPSIQTAVFDPETRKGSEGQSLPLEFETHLVTEDSLWGDWRERFSKKNPLQGL